ncbi:MAG: nickel pincer cofactor biosynthesis protein LarB [Lachnospiraceae bacterium]|jgi:NCAIR mutase (PurE)-related protein
MDEYSVLKKVQSGEMTVEQALAALKEKPFEDLGYAKVDLHRHTRQGATEVIYGEGKTPEQIRGIAGTLKAHRQGHILVTRLNSEKADVLSDDPDFSYYGTARLGVYGGLEPDAGLPRPDGTIAVVCAGTSDLPVAEEAALTAQFYGNKVLRLYDVGVAGLERLLSHLDELVKASVVITVAGMEGALASVVGGLVSCPVIAVPTSVGYGASFQGLAAMLAMMNSCASGVVVVNIDNGFGAAFSASRINRMGMKRGNKTDGKDIRVAGLTDDRMENMPDGASGENEQQHPDRFSHDRDCIGELTCNLDDMSGEEVAFAMEALLKAGARDVFTTPAGMKKGRPGVVLTVLCAPDKMADFEKLIFRLTTTIGIRETVKERAVLRRREEVSQAEGGNVRIKISEGYGAVQIKPEADDLQKAARKTGQNPADIRSEAVKRYGAERFQGVQRACETGTDRTDCPDGVSG